MLSAKKHTAMKIKMLLLSIPAFLWACGGGGGGKTNHSDTTALADTLATRTEIRNEDRPSPQKVTSGFIRQVKVTITYGSPATKGRKIWGELVPWQEVWRAGANETTTMEFGSPVKIAGQPLAAGKYGFFMIPTADEEWTLIFNSEWDTWGAYDYKESNDVLRIRLMPMQVEENAERLDYFIEKNGIRFRWEMVSLFIPAEPAS